MQKSDCSESGKSMKGEKHNKYAVGVCGYFDSTLVGENGQTIRTKNITNELIKHYGADKVRCISTHNWKSRPFGLLFDLISLCRRCERVLVFPDTRAIGVIVPVCVSLKRIFHVKVYYNVVGGWLASRLVVTPRLLRCIEKIDMLFIQTSTMKNELDAIGITNTTVFPNFKLSRIADEQHQHMTFEQPLPCCFYSRVTMKKGVDKMVKAIEEINRNGNILKLDIYGHVDGQYVQHFNELLKSTNSTIRYCGEVQNNKTIDVLENYFLQIFPTEYRTEGHPGSLIDSLYAGLPAVVSKWNSWQDIIKENETGIAYEFASYEGLVEALQYCVSHREQLNKMRAICALEAAKYTPENIMRIMFEIFDNDKFEIV